MDSNLPGSSVLHSSPLSQWCDPTVSSSVTPFSSCLQSFPASVFSNELALRIRWPKWRWCFSFSISASKDFRQGWLVWFPYSPRDSQESSPTSQFESINSLALNLLYGPNFTSLHDYWKYHSFVYIDLCWQSESLLFNTLSRFIRAFFPRSKDRLISWLQSPSTVILESKKIKSATVSTFPLLFAMKWWDWMPQS